MQQVIEKAWNEFAPPLKQFIRARVSQQQDAEDILQTVFVKIQRNINTLREDAKLKSWLYQITRNAIIDYYRSRRDFVEVPEVFPASARDEEITLAQDLLPCVKAMIDCLDERYREPLLMTEYEGLSQQEMAEKLGISLTAAKSRVRRGREKLKEALLACCRFDLDHYGNIVDYTPRACDNKCD